MINRFPRFRSKENKNVSTEQRNFCVKRIRRGKRLLQQTKCSGSKSKKDKLEKLLFNKKK